MAVREDLVSSAVTFLQDPSVAASPVENRVAFLQSKNLSQEEIDTALARAGNDSPASSYNYSTPPPQQQLSRQQPSSYGNYQQSWQAPPELPKRDWRDYFIMATVMGGVSYGLYQVAKRYVIPLIAPPTPPQLEADKAAIDSSFERAFALIDTLASDTAALKDSEAARTERLDTALTEVETVIQELKSASRRREEENHRINQEVKGLKDLIPKAMDAQKESADKRLVELNDELKSLKKLMGQRMAPAAAMVPSPAPYQYNRPTPSQTSGGTTVGAFNTAGSSTVGTGHPAGPQQQASATENATQKTATSASDATAPSPARTSSPFTAGIPAGRSAIPAWQMAAANKTSTPPPAPTVEPASSSQEANA